MAFALKIIENTRKIESVYEEMDELGTSIAQRINFPLPTLSTTILDSVLAYFLCYMLYMSGL